jgi:hypothetical protein
MDAEIARGGADRWHRTLTESRVASLAFDFPCEQSRGRKLSGKGKSLAKRAKIAKERQNLKNMFSRGLAPCLEDFLCGIRTRLEPRAASLHLTLNLLCELGGLGEKNCFLPLAIAAGPPLRKVSWSIAPQSGRPLSCTRPSEDALRRTKYFRFVARLH